MKSLAVLGLLAAAVSPIAAMADDTAGAAYPGTSTAAGDDDGGIGLGLHASTLGYGAELNFTAGEDLVWRLGYNYYSDYTYATTKEDIKYDAHLHLKSYGLALDWHPGAGPFFVSLGAFSNHNDIDAVAVPQQTYTLAGQVFRASDLGNVTAHIEFNSVAPYLGVGFNSLGSHEKGVGFTFGLGVYYQGSPKVHLDGNGPLFGSSLVQPAVQTEQSRLEHDWNSYRYYPVVDLGLVFRF